jgi:flavin-dependent thymidylate synthase
MADSLPLKVKLAGFNVDSETLRSLEDAAYSDGIPPDREAITPETISAAYARISRNPNEIGMIRESARIEVEKARKSNDSIVFGLGHSSVAEHATFNIDVVGISRLAVEAIQRHRLASFTEKSQRYIKLDGDFVMPSEIVDAGLESDYISLIEKQNSAYFELNKKLVEYFKGKIDTGNPKQDLKAAKSYASEDARYLVSLATLSQFGMTLNARTLETMIRDSRAHPLSEINGFGKQISSEIHGLAPSLIKYLDATEYEKSQFQRSSYWTKKSDSQTVEEVKLVDHCGNGVAKIISALLVNIEGLDWDSARTKAEELNSDQRQEFFKNILSQNAQWDPAPREFEMADFTFEMILSSAAFGQIKRHRMSTQITGPYDPSLGWTIPESITAIGGDDLFNEVMRESVILAEKIAEHSPAAAQYALTNAHRRRLIIKTNCRELYHISRLREDQHAQWDIRQLSNKMLNIAREKMPDLFVMAVGKHDYFNRYEEVFGKDHE